MTDKETTELIYQVLRSKYYEPGWGNGRNWVTIREARVGTGYTGLNKRSFDFLAISTKNGNDVIGHEVKASRADFLADLKDPEKQKALRCYSTEFYYVAPKDVVRKEELPPWAGLMELIYRDHDKDYYLSTTVLSPRLHPFAPTWGFVAACIRNRTEPQVRELSQENEELRQELHVLKEEIGHIRLNRLLLRKKEGV